MAYTWTNKTKTGGVGLTGKIVQKGKDDFPLMYASDLDWANVEVESGVNLNTTDDLLDYIKGGNGTINGRIDELELSNAGYEIRCDKSVCYVGDIVGQGYQNQKLPVSIYKNGTLLSWTNAYTEGITFDSNNFTKPSGGNDLIHWSTSDCYLLGEANKIGTYVFNFKKGDVNIASFMLTVLMKPLESYHTTIYISSQTKPTTPTGGSYNFSTKAFTAPSGWSTSITGLTGTIWFSNGSVFSDSGSNPVWSEPCMYFDHDMISIEHQSKNVAVYLTTSSDVTQANTPSGGTYDWSNDTWTVPKTSANANTYWSKTPAASIDAYLGSINTNAEGYQGGKYITWVSYKYYRSDLSDGTRSNFSEGAWSTPVKYIDIDAILDDAETRSQKIVSDAIEDAYSDLQEAASLINEGGVVVDAVRSLYEWKVLDSATTSVITSSDTDLYAPFAARFLSNSQLVGTITLMNTPVSGSTNDILTSAYFNKCIQFDSITDDDGTHTNAYVGYVNTTKELRTQMAALDTQVGTLTTSVNSMTPDKIRLQVSEALQKEYAYVPIALQEFEAQETNNPEKCHKFLYDNSGNLTSTVITELATTAYNTETNNYNGYLIGHYYRRKNAQNTYEYYRCDYPLSTGFMNLLANRATLGVATNKADNGQEKGAFISFGFDGNNDGTAEISANRITLNGDTVAAAIAAQDLNIKNKSYLKSNGDAIFGAGTTGESRFLANGTGYIANGTVRWSDGDTYIENLYIGDPAMGWHINGGAMGPNNEYIDLMPFIWSQYHDTTNSKYVNLAIRPDCIESYSKTTNDNGYGTGTRTVNWSIAQDGSATFAKGNIQFYPDGRATIGNSSTSIEMSDTGNITLRGIGVSISAADLALIGVDVKNSITGDSTFIGTVATAAGVRVIGDLETEDVSVGNGACFFKGDNNSADTDHGRTYPVGSAGAGHLASGNIWWDKVGNLHAKGLMTNRCEYVPGNSNQTVVLDGNNLHSVTLAPTVHRMVVLPTYSDFVDHGSGWTVNGYLQDGTTINIKAEPYDGCSNWSMLKEDSWSASGNYASTADLFKHCILICADPATLCLGAGNNWNLPIHSWKGENPSTSKTVTFENDANVYNNGEWYTPSDNPSYEKEFEYPYRDGRFCARGSYSRFILLLPGQLLTLTSSIQKITVNNTEMSYLVWNVENAADFLCIRTYMIDEIGGNVENGADFDKNDTSMLPYISQSGIGDGLLSYKYMSYDCYAKGDSGRDIERSIFVKINYANSVYDEDDDEMRTVIPSWQTVTLQNTRYASYILNTVNVTIPNN